MHVQRHFTKVYTKPRKPLSQKLERLLEAVEDVVVEDVRFAIKGDETPTNSCPIQKTENKE